MEETIGSVITSAGNGSVWDHENDTHGPSYYDNYLHIISVGNVTATPELPIYRMQKPMDYDELKIINQYIKIFYTPIVITLGVLGNTVTWLILLRSRLRSLSSSHYLAAIIIANTCYLLALIVQWLLLIGIDFYNKPGWCQFVNFFSSASSFLSVWYMVAFAVDRYICICWPTEAPKMCTRMRARVVILALMCISIVVYRNTSLIVGVVTDSRGWGRCGQLPLFKWDHFVLEIMDMFVNLGLPYMVVLVLTVIIACNTYHASSQNLHSDNPSQHRSVTLFYLGYCLICHMPIELFRVIHTARSLFDAEYKYKITSVILLTQRVLQDLFHTSLAAHFFLFLLCYPMFREICKTPFKWLREKTLMKFRQAPDSNIRLRNIRFHAVNEETEVSQV